MSKPATAVALEATPQPTGARSLSGVPISGRTVLIRADLNVPMKGRCVTDTTRIDRFAPTINRLAMQGARVIVMSHLGRPDGKPDPAYSLAPVAGALSAATGRPVTFIPACIGTAARSGVHTVPYGGIGMLENLRFHEQEEANDDGFARELATLGDVYVNDAFSCAHRAHASTHRIAQLLPSYAGPSMEMEIAALTLALERPERPMAALVGGAKVSSKIPVLEYLLPKVDVLIIGGGMANTFLLAQGRTIGRSLAEPGHMDTARRILASAASKGCEIVLPVDVVAADEFKAGARWRITDADAVPGDSMILDVGPRTVEELSRRLASVRTLLWNGPLGAFETEPFGAATFALARAARDRTALNELVTIAGGGDTVAALNAAGVKDDFTYVSTAGGAFLEWLEGKTLPGVEVLLGPQTIKES